MEKHEILAEKEFCQRGNNGTKDKKAKEGHKDHREQFEGQNITKHLHTTEMFKYAIEDKKRTYPEKKAQRTQKK